MLFNLVDTELPRGLFIGIHFIYFVLQHIVPFYWRLVNHLYSPYRYVLLFNSKLISSAYVTVSGGPVMQIISFIKIKNRNVPRMDTLEGTPGFSCNSFQIIFSMSTFWQRSSKLFSVKLGATPRNH